MNTTTDDKLSPPRRTFAGVTIFDCRLPDDAETPRAPWGEALFGSERAAYALGMRKGWCHCDDVPALSVQTNADLRADADAYRATARRLVREFKARMADYQAAAAGRQPGPEEGGAVVYQPVAVALSNFGGTILCDRRVAAVRPFE